MYCYFLFLSQLPPKKIYVYIDIYYNVAQKHPRRRRRKHVCWLCMGFSKKNSGIRWKKSLHKPPEKRISPIGFGKLPNE